MNKNKGFSLIELMVVVAIVALILAYAIPNYRQYVLKGKRAEAHNRVMQIAGQMERFYANTNQYPTGLTGGGTALDLNADYITWNEYEISLGGGSLNGNDPAGWNLTATAINQQTEDTACPLIQFDNLGQKQPADCWK